MNIKQAKNIKIEILLSKYWYKPSRQNGRDIWYISPLRKESTASFKVNTTLNTRYDFGLSMGGDIVKFICDFQNTDIKWALSILDSSPRVVDQSPVHQTKITDIETSTGLKLLKAWNFNFYPLVEYLKNRSISRWVWEKYLVQVEYIASNNKEYKAIGFKNDAWDYEVRNKYFKGFVWKTKTITSLNIENAKTILVFEWFFDFLSYCTKFQNISTNSWYIILNWVYGQDKAIEKINAIKPTLVQFFLDNDEAGIKAYKEMTQAITTESFANYSHMYEWFKDFSEMWQNKSL